MAPKPVLNKIPLTPEIIRQLKNQGMNQSEIARHTGHSRQAVSDCITRYGMRKSPRQELLEAHFPWKVPVPQCNQSPYRGMRAHAEWYVTNGQGMSDDNLARLRTFYKKLRDENLVLEYDPTIPPVPGMTKHGGFAYRKRRKSDRGLMIRVNEYTNMTEQGWDIWRLPPVDP